MNRFNHSSLRASSTSSLLHKSIPEIYCSCELSVIPTTTLTTNASTNNDDNITLSNNNDCPSSSSQITKIISSSSNNDESQKYHQEYQTTVYYRDTKSKRSQVVIPILLTFENDFDRKAMIKSGAIQPLPTEQSSTMSLSSSSLRENKNILDKNEKDMNTKQTSFGSELWSSELDTLGETSGDFMTGDDAEKMELKFECICDSSDCGTIVEGVTILSTSKVDTDDVVGIRFDVEITVKTSSSSSSSSLPTVETINITSTNDTKENDINKTCLQIKSLLICTSSSKSNNDDSQYYRPSKQGSFKSLYSNDEQHQQQLDTIILARQALDMGIHGISPYSHEDDNDEINILPSSSYFERSLSYCLPPPIPSSSSTTKSGLYLHINLVPALTIQVKEINGASSSYTGVTLVSLLIGHSNLHNEDVTITNIALHPGHSRLFSNSSSIEAGESTMINMTKNVQWGYAKGTAPSLPFTLKPNDAVATVIQISASEMHASRIFICPIGVLGIVGRSDEQKNPKQENYKTSVVMVSADAKWTTSQVTNESSNAFRVNLSVLEESKHHCHVGSQVLVSLKVKNLSDEPRNLTLVMAKEEYPEDDIDTRKHDVNSFADGDVRESNESMSKLLSTNTQPALGVNDAVVSEVNGYTFSVWGLNGNDDGTVRYNRDHELLAVDAKLLLGEVKGQQSIEAKLRFIPLREGSLKVPNLRLYDDYNQRWYDCNHTLRLITSASQ